MSEKSRIISRYANAVKKQEEIFSSKKRLLLKRANKLPNYEKSVNRIFSMFNSYEPNLEEHPLPSHRLMRAIYTDIAEGKEIPGTIKDAVKTIVLPSMGLKLPEEYTKLGLGSAGHHYCSNAEITNIDVIDQVKTGEDNGQSRLSIYWNDRGPQLLRKKEEESSALMLVDGQIDGVFVPKGTFVQVDKLMNSNLTGEFEFPGNCSIIKYESYFCNELTVAPGRLSPWVHNKEPDIKDYFSIIQGSQPIYNSARRKLISEVTMKNFLRTSKKILELTGVSR